MAQSLSIGIIVGSVRPGAISLPLAQWVAETMATHDALDPALIDLAQWSLPPFALPRPPAMGDYTDPLQKRWAAEIARHDGFVFVTPEYNRGTSAALKNAIDYVYAEWARKPVAIVSHGSLGGLGAAQALRATLGAINTAPLGTAVYVQGAHARVKNGRFASESRDDQALCAVLEELHWWALALKAGRG